MVYCVTALSGCSSVSYEGKDLVDKAKQIHTELEAAHITVSDNNTGDVLQEITYRFEGDVMQYMYIGRDTETGEEYYEFNNGTELDTWHTGNSGWTAVAKGSEGFYNYSRAKRHYFADGALLLNDYPSAVVSSEVHNEAGGGKTIRLRYDDDRLYRYQSLGDVTGMEQTYMINNTPGEPGYMTLQVSYTRDGDTFEYRIVRTQTDPSAPIERIEPPALSEGISSEITENVQ